MLGVKRTSRIDRSFFFFLPQEDILRNDQAFFKSLKKKYS